MKQFISTCNSILGMRTNGLSTKHMMTDCMSWLCRNGSSLSLPSLYYGSIVFEHLYDTTNKKYHFESMIGESVPLFLATEDQYQYDILDEEYVAALRFISGYSGLMRFSDIRNHSCLPVFIHEMDMQNWVVAFRNILSNKTIYLYQHRLFVNASKWLQNVDCVFDYNDNNLDLYGKLIFGLDSLHGDDATRCERGKLNLWYWNVNALLTYFITKWAQDAGTVLEMDTEVSLILHHFLTKGGN